MNRTFANAVTRVPNHKHVFCAALSQQQTELTSDELRVLRGGVWQLVVRLIVTTLASFEAGYQYGRFRDSLTGSPEPGGPSDEEQPERHSGSFHTAAADNTRVGS